MAAVTTVVEGNIKFREGKKWKSRWCIIKKSSPVADCLQIFLYKNVCESSKPNGKCKSIFTLDSFFGLDASVSYDREPYVLAIICEKNVFLFAFDLREDMIQFEIKIRQSLGEEHRFLVKVMKAPSSTKLPKEQLYLIIHDTRFCLTAHSPPKIIMSWNIVDLRRYGINDGKFCFEGGASCGKGAGLFVLQSDQTETIADIIHFAATGKMSNCHRKFKNRSSQIDLGSHLIAEIPSLPSQSSSSHLHHIHHSVAKGPLQGALPTTLNCCQPTQTGSAESEDWNWYKRHSVSVMDYRRIAAVRDKTGAETRDQLSVGIYDVPPNHDRKLGSHLPTVIDEHGYDHPRSFCPGSETSTSTSISTSLHRHEYCNTVDSHLENCDGDYKYLDGKKDSVLRKIVKESNSVQSHTDEYSQTTPMSRNETLQKLKKQEYNIQKEMRLLDEMLQNCAGQNMEPPIPTSNSFVLKNFVVPNKTPPKTPGNSLYANYDEIPAKPRGPMLAAGQESVVSHVETRPLTVTSVKDFEIISGNISVKKMNQGQSDITNKRRARPSLNLYLNKSLPEETPISPLFHAKLSSIPSGSKLNAPLPYVNLSRYDDDSTSHVHLPGSADCLLVARGSSFSSLNVSRENQNKGPVVWRQHAGSLSSLHTPVAASSLTNLNRYSELTRNKKQSAQAHFQLKQAIEGHSHIINDDHPEILVVDLNGKDELKEKHKGSLSQLAMENSTKTDTCDSELVSLLTTDKDHGKQQPAEVQTKYDNEGIYENLPVVREDTPPPALPPKGPALLKKLKAAKTNANIGESRYKHTTPSPTPHRQNKSFNSVHDYSFGYDTTQSAPEFSHKDMPVNDQDENYLHMGSPKTAHKLSATVPISGPNKKKMGPNANARDDYMDMGVIAMEVNDISNDTTHEDEIYLDVDETIRSSKYYVPDGKTCGKSAPLGLPPPAGGPVRESTYVEMVTVSNRKSMVLQNLETLQAVVSKKPGGEKVQAPTVSQSPLPRPYKVRHNSDSGLSSRETGDIDANTEKSKTKSPMKVYTKVKSTDAVNKNPTEPPLPFENLMDFTKKSDSRPTYVNTYIDADKNLTSLTNDFRSIPLPEPVKEGFLARFKRRSSRDKGSPAPEKSTSVKNRSSILERSMSEHGSPKSNKEEKNSKLKIGRRRSSSFPNRLSYQESHEDDSSMPVVKNVESSSCGFSPSQEKSKSPMSPAEQSESSSTSRHDISDESDISPLLKRSGRKSKLNAVTVMHVQHTYPIDRNLYMHTSRSTSCLVSQIPNSSKTDDEKLSEIIDKDPTRKHFLKDSFDDSTLSDVSFDKISKGESNTEYKFKSSHLPPHLEMNNVKENGSEYCLMDPPKSEVISPLSVSVESDDLEPPTLPPKSRNYLNLLSPVLEATLPPALPPRQYIDAASQPAENVTGGTSLDQYVELSNNCGNQDRSAYLTSGLDPKA